MRSVLQIVKLIKIENIISIMVAKKKIIADMHTHLNEKNIDPNDWWAAVKKRKLSVIAITEHAEYTPGTAYQKLLPLKPENVILIPGMEANTTAGHLLIYGTDSTLYNVPDIQTIKVPFEKALSRINEYGLTASFAHPYGYKDDSICSILGEKKARQTIKKYKVGSEYYNGMLGSANNFIFGAQWVKKLYNFFDFMSKSNAGKKLMLRKKSIKIKTQLERVSEETFERVRKGMSFGLGSTYISAGSDAHYPRAIGSSVVELKKMPKNEADFLKMIQSKQINWAGPNIYSKEPMNNIRKKELLEGLKYAVTKRIKKKIKRTRK